MDDAEAAPLHVVLAEDDHELREILAAALRREGHHVIEVGDGRRLSETIAAAAVPGGPAIDLVVTDVRMPGPTGLAVMDAATERPPFIVMTAVGDDGVRREAERLGALVLLDKPFPPSALCHLLDHYARSQR